MATPRLSVDNLAVVVVFLKKIKIPDALECPDMPD